MSRYVRGTFAQDPCCDWKVHPGMTLLKRSRSNLTKAYVTSFGITCSQWRCRKCGQERAKKTLAKLETRLKDVAGDQAGKLKLYTARVPKDRMKAVGMAQKKRGGGRVALKLLDDTALVVSDVDVFSSRQAAAGLVVGEVLFQDVADWIEALAGKDGPERVTRVDWGGTWRGNDDDDEGNDTLMKMEWPGGAQERRTFLEFYGHPIDLLDSGDSQILQFGSVAYDRLVSHYVEWDELRMGVVPAVLQP